MALATTTVNIPGSDARYLRAEVLDKRRLDGLTYRVVSPWWSFFTTRIELTGPPGVVESTKARIEAWLTQAWADRQW